VNLFALDENAAAVTRHRAAQDLDQGGLASPVLAQHHVDLALEEVEVDAVKRVDPGEMLIDLLHAEKRLVR
jgi:hypothetical protein